MLQGIDAKHPGDLILGALPVGPFGAHHVGVAAAEKLAEHAKMLKTRVAKIAQHGLWRRRLHGQVVVRIRPRLVGRLVAAGTALAAHIGRRRGRRSRRGSAGTAG